MRFQRIDAFRLYAIFTIVCAHVQFFGGLNHESSSKLLELVSVIGARWTMPFFFIVSGYFVGGKIIQEPSKAISTASKYTKRLAKVFLFWCVIYAVAQPQSFLSLLQEAPIKLLLEGTSVHLWFLVSLILTIWLFALWPFGKKSVHFLLLGGALYVYGLLGGSYKVTPLGFEAIFNTRNGIFFSTLFFAIGVAFHNRMPRVGKLMAAGLAFTGLAIFCLEAYYLRAQWSVPPINHDYLLGTIPGGVGVFLLVFAHRDSRIARFVGQYGQYVLGIYVSHMAFIDLWRPFGSFAQATAWQFIFPVLVFGSSLLASMIMSKTALRRVVV